MRKLCAIGEALIDFVPMEKGRRLKDVTSFRRVVGGAPLNVAGAFCKLGGNAKMITKVGNDAFGDCIIDAMIQVGIDCQSVLRSECYDTSLAFVSLADDGNRDFQFYRRNCADLSLRVNELCEDVLEDSGIFHFCSVSLVESEMKQTHIALLEKALNKDIIISFDPNLRFSLWNDEEALKQTVLAFLPYANIVKISDEELTFITGEYTIEEALPFFFANKRCEMVVYTKGKDGATIYTRQNQASVSGLSVEVVDTTGAGDAFIAAFLVQVAKMNFPLSSWNQEQLNQAITYANAYGALAVMKQGAMDVYVNDEALQLFMRERGSL